MYKTIVGLYPNSVKVSIAPYFEIVESMIKITYYYKWGGCIVEPSYRDNSYLWIQIIIFLF